jgi:alpha-galactosidase
VIQTADTVVWAARLDDGSDAIAVFNLTGQTANLEYSWAALGLKGSRYGVRNLWERKDLGAQTSLRVQVAPHASALLGLR